MLFFMIIMLAIIYNIIYKYKRVLKYVGNSYTNFLIQSIKSILILYNYSLLICGKLVLHTKAINTNTSSFVKARCCCIQGNMFQI